MRPEGNGACSLNEGLQHRASQAVWATGWQMGPAKYLPEKGLLSRGTLKGVNKITRLWSPQCHEIKRELRYMWLCANLLTEDKVRFLLFHLWDSLTLYCYFYRPFSIALMLSKEQLQRSSI